MRTLLIAAVALFPTLAVAQAWMVETVEDEFTGERSTYVTQVGDDRELVLDIVCDAAGHVLALSAGPGVTWAIFKHGDIGIRYDQGPPITERFEDLDTSLASPGFDLGLLTGAATLTVQVAIYPLGTETDTFQLRGLAETLRREPLCAS